MRVVRIAPARQLAFFPGRAVPPDSCWAGLPERSRSEVLALLARIIARGVVAGDTHDGLPGWYRSVPNNRRTGDQLLGRDRHRIRSARCRPTRSPPERRSTAVRSGCLDHLDAQVCKRRTVPRSGQNGQAARTEAG